MWGERLVAIEHSHLDVKRGQGLAQEMKNP